MYSNYFEKLPLEINFAVLYRLKLRSLFQAIQVSKRFALVLEEEQFWKQKISDYFHRNTPFYLSFPSNYDEFKYYLHNVTFFEPRNFNIRSNVRRIRNLFIGICDSDIESLDKENLRFEDLFTVSNAFFSLWHLAMFHNDQAVLDVII